MKWSSCCGECGKMHVPLTFTEPDQVSRMGKHKKLIWKSQITWCAAPRIENSFWVNFGAWIEALLPI